MSGVDLPPAPGGPDQHDTGAVVDGYLAAWRAGDFEAARSRLAEDAPIHARTLTEDMELCGFDAFLEFFARRRVELATSSWHVVNRMTGDHHVSILTRLRAGDRTWYALSVYAVAGNLITEMWLHEPF